MNKLPFFISGTVGRMADEAILLAEEDPREALVEAAVQSISTGVNVTVGRVTMHLAGWMDPEHWESDWREAGVEDVDAFLAEHVSA